MKKLEFDFDVEAEVFALKNEARSIKTSFSLRPTTEKRLRGLSMRMNVPMSSVVDRALELYLAMMDQRP